MSFAFTVPTVARRLLFSAATRPILASRCRKHRYSMHPSTRSRPFCDKPNSPSSPPSSSAPSNSAPQCSSDQPQSPSSSSSQPQSSKPSSSLPGPTMVRARHILVDSEKMVDMVRSQLDSGKSSFAELASMVSTCPSKERGGDLGWFPRQTMVREFEDAAFGNKPGSIVKVKSEFGWHLIRVEQHGRATNNITVAEFARRFAPDAPESDENCASVQFIDVRERSEVEVASLPGFLVLPMGEYELWADDFDSGALDLEKDKETIVMCHHGIRSANFCSFLSQAGFTVVRNLTGGIDAYSREIDPSVPTY